MIEVQPEELAGIIQKDLRDILEGVSQKVLDGVIARTPVKSGKLKKGWYIDDSNQEEIQVNNDVPYAGIVENGSAHQPPVGMMATTILGLDSFLSEYDSQ